jgi:hypothetical protein
MSFRRYEIILPTRYNDGTPVDQSKYWETAEEWAVTESCLQNHPESAWGSPLLGRGLSC